MKVEKMKLIGDEKASARLHKPPEEGFHFLRRSEKDPTCVYSRVFVGV